jgi:hypothetical protein
LDSTGIDFSTRSPASSVSQWTISAATGSGVQGTRNGVSSDGPPGLGLALSQSLTRAMGGELAYRPNDGGGGAAFALRLPRA